jgi:hypothetical protein
MSEAEAVRIARENVDAWTAGDWDRLRAALTADVVYDEVGSQRRLVGIDGIGIVRFLRRPDRPSATPNLRVGGSIPPRLTSLRSHLSRRLSRRSRGGLHRSTSPPYFPQHSDPAYSCRLRILHGARP